jgi:hypothetical protein
MSPKKTSMQDLKRKHTVSSLKRYWNIKKPEKGEKKGSIRVFRLPRDSVRKLPPKTI